MKGVVESINKNPYLVLLLSVLKIWDFVKPFIIEMDESVSQYYSNYDWVGFALYMVVVLILFAFVKRHKKLELEIQATKLEIQAISLVSSMRNEYFFIQQFKDQKISKLPSETMEDYFKRLPRGEYRNYLHNEYEKAVDIFTKKQNLKPSDAKEIISKIYEK